VKGKSKKRKKGS